MARFTARCSFFVDDKGNFMEIDQIKDLETQKSLIFNDGDKIPERYLKKLITIVREIIDLEEDSNPVVEEKIDNSEKELPKKKPKVKAKGKKNKK